MSVEYELGDLVLVDTVPNHCNPFPAVETWALLREIVNVPPSAVNPHHTILLRLTVDQHPAPEGWPHGAWFLACPSDIKERIPAAKVPDARINQFMERPEQEPQEEFVAAFNSGAALEACTDDELLAELTKRLGFRRDVLRDRKPNTFTHSPPFDQMGSGSVTSK